MIVTISDREEVKRLTQGIERLQDYMHSNDFYDLPGITQGLMMVQLESMKVYLGALIRRIEMMENDQ